MIKRWGSVQLAVLTSVLGGAIAMGTLPGVAQESEGVGKRGIG